MAQGRDPISDLMVLQDRMNRLFEEASQRRACVAAEPAMEPGTTLDHVEWVPAADVYEVADQYIVALDLPGVDRSALEIDLEHDELAIRGSRASESQMEHRPEVRAENLPGALACHLQLTRSGLRQSIRTVFCMCGCRNALNKNHNEWK